MKLQIVILTTLCVGLVAGCGLFRQPIDQSQDLGFEQMPFSGSGSSGARFQSPDNAPEFGFQQTQSHLEQQPVDAANIVLDLEISGNTTIPTHVLLRNIRTRPGRYFDPDLLQQDVNELWQMKEIQRVIGPYVNQTAEGVVINIEVVERQLLQSVKFIGNRGITDKALYKETNLSDGQPLDIHEIRMVKHRIEEFYQDKGYPNTQVEVLEGNEHSDSSAIFLIHEDEQQRIWNVEFEGNNIATDARLKSLIESKPGILKLVGGLVKRQEVDQDVLRLTSYYRGLGFFNARIGRDVIEHENGRWITLRFVIDEGPRYKIRNVSFIGNNVFNREQLLHMVEMKPSAIGGQNPLSIPGIENVLVQNQDGTLELPEFNSSKMNQDLVSLRDLYGANGYVHSDVQVETRFLEEPGTLDLVYKIKEGKQYRVRNINVHIEGSSGTTRREVALNRLSFQPGDIIDLREIRDSKRRLGSSQVFATGQDGTAPEILVVPDGQKGYTPKVGSASRTAARPSPSAGSGRSSGGSGGR